MVTWIVIVTFSDLDGDMAISYYFVKTETMSISISRRALIISIIQFGIFKRFKTQNSKSQNL